MARRVRIGLLGPLEVSLDGEPVDIGGSKRRALLARLAVRPGEVVPAELLLHDLWAGKPPSAGLVTLQSHIAHLRRALGGAGTTVTTVSPGYVLRLEATSIDAVSFARVVASARANLDPGGRAREIDGGLQLWRGRPLVEFEGDEWADPIAHELDELRLEAEDLRAEAQLRLGHHAALVPRLEALTESHPFRERLWLHLMAALQGCGRHVEALRAGQRLRAVLGEIGVSPSAELGGLEARILRHLPNGDDEPPRSGPVVPTVRPARLQQPDRFTLVGRDREVLALRSAVDRLERDGQRVVLVAGEAGVGKSRLVRCAASLAREWGGLVLEGRCDDALAIP
jgi:DNA-binding SARP family transcriptional activator